MIHPRYYEAFMSKRQSTNSHSKAKVIENNLHNTHFYIKVHITIVQIATLLNWTS